MPCRNEGLLLLRARSAYCRSAAPGPAAIIFGDQRRHGYLQSFFAGPAGDHGATGNVPPGQTGRCG